MPPTICWLNRSKLDASSFVFFNAKLKRHGRFTSDLVGLWWGWSVPTGTRIFSRTRAPVRPLCHAEVRRDTAQRSPRYPSRSLRRSAMPDDIDGQFRGLGDNCTDNVPDEFRAHTMKRSNSPAQFRSIRPKLGTKTRTFKNGRVTD